MKQLMWSIFFAMATALGFAGCHTGTPSRIVAADLGNPAKYEVIGTLGQPLCRFMQVHAVVIDGDHAGTKRFGGAYLLDVTQIGARVLPKPVTMGFDDLSHELPSNIFERYEQYYGMKSGTIAGKEQAAMNRDYVGRKYVLKVHETAAFRTPPIDDDWGDLGPRQGAGYGCETKLVVWKIISGASIAK